MKCFRICFVLGNIAIFFTLVNYALADQSNSLHIRQNIGIVDGQTPRFWNQLPRNGISKLLQISNLLTNIRDIRFDGVSTTISGNLVTLRNLRILSDTTDFNDYIVINFLTDLASLSLISVALDITPDLGVFVQDNGFFSKDVSAEIFLMTNSGNTLEPDQLHSITAGLNDTFTMSLEAGTLITIRSWNPTDDYVFQVDQPNGSPSIRRLFPEGSSFTLFRISVLQSGVYTFRFVPENDPTVTLQFGFTNNNRTPLQDEFSGGRISVSLHGWGQEYAKYRIQLEAGDLIEVADPSDDDIWLHLVNSNSLTIQEVQGAVFVRAPLTDTYYLFVQNRDFSNGSNYSGTITITPDPDRSRYPILNPIPQQFSNAGEPFALQLSASNEPRRYQSTGLPPAVSLDETSGLISGTPMISGTFPIRVSVENEFGSDQENFLLTIQ